MDRYLTPLFTARETARALRMPESTLDPWLASPTHAPLVHAVTPQKRGWPRVPFVGVVEAYVLRALRESGLRMQDIRTAAEIVRREFDDPYALAQRRIATDGLGIFVRLADESIIHAPDRQSAIDEVVRDHLRYISWDDAGRPQALRLAQFPAGAAVIINPDFAWGAPVLESTRTPVGGIVDLWRAGDPMIGIAEEYGLSIRVVEDVLRQAA